MTGKLPIVIDELLKYRQSAAKQTNVFTKLKHNAHLCPAFERQTNRILDCFLKFHSIAYDVQGINDRGTDVLLRYEVNLDGESINRYIAFQIKSYDDIISSNYLKNLKSQWFEAKAEFNSLLDHYYILLCTDSHLHKNKIRQIKKTFSTSENTTVIDPLYSATFLRLNSIRISSIVSAILRDDDIIYAKASSDLMMYTPTEIAIYSAIVLEVTLTSRRKFDINIIKENGFVRDIYAALPDYPKDYYFYLEEESFDLDDDEAEIDDLSDNDIEEYTDQKRDFNERFAEDVDNISGGVFSFDASSGMVEVDLEVARPLQAIMLDGMVRYDCGAGALLQYVFSALAIMNRFGFDDMENEEWPAELLLYNI
ncbi:MAG: hypothetical protein K9N21_13690 [Deltaproteobacteria bacterium]|nr:hypothetical protein [Deltaproteobacteria bacterium]